MTDVNIIKGLSSIINVGNIKPGIDLNVLEQQMINEQLMETTDPVDRLSDELDALTAKLGVSFTSDDVPDEGSAGQVDDNYDEPIFVPNAEPDYAPYESAYAPKPFTENLQDRTMEQRRRGHIETIVGSSSDMFSLEEEKKEDAKAVMLSEIGDLMSSLSDENVDLSRVPEVSQQSSYKDVETVLRILRHKNDHTHYTTLAEEFLLFGAYTLEDLFDGNQVWFDRYQPDLRGYHNNMRVKLRRLRHDTGQIVSSVMQDYNIPPFLRLIFELIPNMFMYSKSKKNQSGQPSLCSDQQMQYSTDNISSI